MLDHPEAVPGPAGRSVAAPRVWGRVLWLLSMVGVAAAILLGSRPASAYPWMIRHQYTGCTPCHADPSGAGLLTEYGRAQSDLLLRTRYGGPPPEEASTTSRFLWAVPQPEWLLLGGSVRNAFIINKAPGAAFDARFLQMQADLRAQVTVSRFRASGSLGYMWQNAGLTQITQRAQHNLVSREHWLGVDLGEDKQMLLRAGRMNLPFGLRNPEHTMFVRSATRTSFNDGQQHGLAFSYTGSKARGEIMAVLGNYQVNPDAFRERGYSGFIEIPVAQKATVGASSLVTYARTERPDDPVSPMPGASKVVRQAHGAFSRLSFWDPLVIMIEADALVRTSSDKPTSAGMAGMVQLDFEAVQGLHLMVTGETMVATNAPMAAGTGTASSFAGWATINWFFLPHCDLRFDFVTASLSGSKPSLYLLPQLHIFL
jgi:hypothetical protein